MLLRTILFITETHITQAQFSIAIDLTSDLDTENCPVVQHQTTRGQQVV